MRKTSEAPATINSTQNVQRQLTTETKPDMMGERIGPQVVA